MYGSNYGAAQRRSKGDDDSGVPNNGDNGTWVLCFIWMATQFTAWPLKVVLKLNFVVCAYNVWTDSPLWEVEAGIFHYLKKCNRDVYKSLD